MKKCSLGLALLVVFMSGCYKTKVRTSAASSSHHSDRQWFTIAGLVPLSGAAGSECPQGVATSESKYSGVDFLIAVGLTLGGVAAGAALCDADASDAAYTSCITGTANLVPFLIGSRTVEYTCAGGGYVPPPGYPAQGTYPPPGASSEPASLMRAPSGEEDPAVPASE